MTCCKFATILKFSHTIYDLKQKGLDVDFKLYWNWHEFYSSLALPHLFY